MGHTGGDKNPRKGSGRGADAGPPTAKLTATRVYIYETGNTAVE